MLHIADIALHSPFILAPLAGYTDLPFRLLCREYGAGLCVSEMISCHGLSYKQQKTLSMLASHPDEKPVAFQLFGADPEIMADAAALMAHHHPDMIDINMGCPVRKVTKRGAGAALMRDPVLASEIICGVRERSGLPVTVKFRLGPDNNHLNCEEFAVMAERAGAVAVTLHARTWSQGFTGSPDYTFIRRVKEAVSVPVIGNGDIFSYQQGIALMQETDCDGVMIGRAALGNPWVFQQTGRPEHLENILAGVLRHLELMEAHLPTERMLGVIKNHIGRYFKSMPGSSALRKQVYDSTTFQALQNTLLQLQRTHCD